MGMMSLRKAGGAVHIPPVKPFGVQTRGVHAYPYLCSSHEFPTATTSPAMQPTPIAVAPDGTTATLEKAQPRIVATKM